MDSLERLYESQFEWFLQLYGFGDEQDLQEYLSDKSVILDAGCGLGYKAAWFARLAPQATVIGIDISDAAYQAAANFRELPNLVYLKGDIANTGIKPNSVDLVVCDQVIMHTENPEETFRHLSDITKPGGEFACYVYAKKALPRELIDDYFRNETHDVTSEQMWEMSEQLTELGKRLSELNVSFEAPNIPLLGIKGGTYDIQRFIYWNFLKCFWKEDWGFEMSKATNYDWYAPSNAKRYNREEFEQMIRENNLQISYFHQEEACYSGRFAK
jgi:SAM-dependent methyltransferase